MSGVAVPSINPPAYTFSGSLVLTGAAVTWNPNLLTTKATPITADSVAGYDSVGAAPAKFLLSAIPVSTPQAAADLVAQGRYRAVTALPAGVTILALTDMGSLRNSGATNASVTVPLNATVAFTAGDKIDLLRGGAGTLFITAVAGVSIITSLGTVTSAGPTVEIAGTGYGGSLTYLGGDVWWLVGALAS